MLGLSPTSTWLPALGPALPRGRSASPSARLGFLLAPLPGCLSRYVRGLAQDRATVVRITHKGGAHA